jgi:uncharacterized cofD-like protein
MKIVAFGGGHGLAASLRALRSLSRKQKLDLTAVVTVGDDGGSSGRLRVDRGIVPPGDIRQALAALADEADPAAGQTAALLQHRFAGSDPLTGHPVGNLMLCGLMELLGDPVLAIDHVAAMVRASGRVLPMSCNPVWLEADITGPDGGDITIRGQHNVAVAKGQVRTLRLNPAPAPCAEAVAATRAADWLIFGPGSWYTSVIPHLLIPELAEAIAHSTARRLITLNLAVEQETSGLSLPDHLAALTRYLPGLRVDVVLADGNAVGAPEPLRRAAESLGAELVLAPVAVRGATTRHDPAALAAALEPILSA